MFAGGPLKGSVIPEDRNFNKDVRTALLRLDVWSHSGSDDDAGDIRRVKNIRVYYFTVLYSVLLQSFSHGSHHTKELSFRKFRSF